MQAAWGINTMRERPVCSCGLWSFWRCGGMASVSGVLQWRGEYGHFRKYRRKTLGGSVFFFLRENLECIELCQDRWGTESLFARIFLKNQWTCKGDIKVGVYYWSSEQGRVVDQVLYRGTALSSQTLELMGTLTTPHLLEKQHRKT